MGAPGSGNSMPSPTIWIILSAPGSWKGSGFSSTPLTTVNIAVVVPMPSASVARATATKPGWRRRERSAKRRSWSSWSTRPPGGLEMRAERLDEPCRVEVGPRVLLKSGFVRGRTSTAYARPSGAVAKW